MWLLTVPDWINMFFRLSGGGLQFSFGVSVWMLAGKFIANSQIGLRLEEGLAVVQYIKETEKGQGGG